MTGREPMALLPEVQPIADSGVPGYESVGWFGLIAPSGVPRDVIIKLNDEISRLLQLPE